jgi:hypothetical protein
MSTTRFLTGSFAAVAVASAVSLATPSAYAADEPGQPCGVASIPAVFQTVTHDAVYRTTPAVTHQEWRWEREVTTYEHEYSKVTPASTTVDWTREVIDQAAVPAVPGTPEVGHFETVVTVPAVTETLAEFVQLQTGKTRWESPDWAAQNGQGQGWEKTGNTREDVITPAQTEQHWVVDQAATPGTPGSPLVSHTETATTTGDAPDGTGWTQAAVHNVPAATDIVWALEAPDGYTATGNSKVHDVTTEQTDAPSATAPEGDGWSTIAGSEIQVVDVEEITELVTPGFTEQVLVSPEVPSTEPCVSDPDPVVAGPTGESTSVSGVQNETSAVAAPAATVLPNTGNPASVWLTATAFGVLLAGGALVQVGRRRPTS